ncbi:MAG: cytochrome c oxidase assembly protein [Rhodospirillales bacterium]|nr:cytochrome c oxidase assembly protein [Rhodospirillales bacterium]
MAVVLGLVVCGMVGLSFAAVPLYRLFCQVTGYGGTPQIADAVPDAPFERQMKIRFDANVAPGLPWQFEPEVRQVTVKIGEPTLIYYKARNMGELATAGTATFNVTPLKVGQYFGKVQCFCFTEQVLQPGQEIDMGVSFFVDPALAEDPNLDEVKTVTLSYTFFADSGSELAPLPGSAKGDRVN